MSNKIILNVDASALKEASCTRRFIWNVHEGFREPLNNNDLEFGSAFHEFVKVMKCSGGNYALGIEAAVKRYNVPMNIKYNKGYMTSNYLQNVCLNFWEQWVKKDDFETLTNPSNGQPLVELKFSYPYYTSPDIEVRLTGTIDDLCKHRHGTYALRDYKTTSMYDKKTYLAGYVLSPQLLFYRMMVKYYAKTYPKSIFADINMLDVGCFIDGIFLQGKDKPAEFARSEVFMFPAAQLAEFEKLVAAKVAHLVASVRHLIASKQMPARDGMLTASCETVYGHCKFFAACKQVDDVSAQHMLNKHFIKRVYDPLTFGSEHIKQTTPIQTNAIPT